MSTNNYFPKPWDWMILFGWNVNIKEVWELDHAARQVKVWEDTGKSTNEKDNLLKTTRMCCLLSKIRNHIKDKGMISCFKCYKWVKYKEFTPRVRKMGIIGEFNKNNLVGTLETKKKILEWVQKRIWREKFGMKCREQFLL